MIDDLDKTLTSLLVQEVATLTAERIYFEAPDDAFAPGLPAVNLFLYDVRENWGLRSNEWQIEESNGAFTRRPPPVRVDCSYLITAWAGDIDSEHRLLGEVMGALLRHQVFPTELLQGTLQAQEPPVRAAPLQASQLQSLGEFWQAMGGQPKAMLNYTLTISVPSGPAVDLGPPVSDRRFKFKVGDVEEG